jgi:hypothetical protein
MQTITLGSLALDAGDFRLLAIDFNMPPTEIHEVTSALADKNLQADVRTSAYRDIVVSVAVTGSTKQALIDNLKTLGAEIAKDSNALTVLPDGQADYMAVYFALGRSPEPELPFDQAFEAGNVAHVSFVLKAEPYGYAKYQLATNSPTPWSQAQTFTGCPDLKSFTIYGDRQVPVDLLVTRTVGSNMHLVYVAPTTSTSVSDHLAEAEALTWSGGSTVSDTAAHAGSTKTVTGTTERNAIWTMPANLANGRYRLLVRAKINSSPYVGVVKVTTGAETASTPCILQQNVSATAWTVYDLGEIDIPQRQLRSGGSGTRTLKFWASTDNASAVLSMDYFVLVPVDGLFRFHAADTECALTNLRLATDGVAYRDDYANLSGVSGQTMRLKPGSQNLLVVIDELTAGATLPSCTVTVQHTPRHVLWRS